MSDFGKVMKMVFPLVQLPKKFKAIALPTFLKRSSLVSISSTSEEVQRIDNESTAQAWNFPLVQLPKKFKACAHSRTARSTKRFPLVQLPKKFKVSTERMARHFVRQVFPLVQLPKKFKAAEKSDTAAQANTFH